jgi:type VI secretion system protein ImpJ
MKLTSQPMRTIWSEGLLISPQHLQLQDRYHEGLLDARVSSLTPYAWGTSTIALDHTAIEGGEVRLLAFRGIMPDGQALYCDRNEAHLPGARPVAEHFTASSTTVDVYLCSYAERDGLPNYDGLAGITTARDERTGETRTRFRAVTRRAFDLTAQGAEMPVQVAAPAPVLRFGSENRDDFVSIKIAEIARTNTGGFRYVKEYIPPALSLAASEYLQGLVQDVASAAVARHRELAEQRRQRDQASVEFTAKDITRYLFLSALAGCVPELAHLTLVAETSPLSAYFSLCRLAGHLSVFAADIDPAKLPHYQHHDLRATFAPLVTMLRELLGAGLRENYIKIPLESRKDGLWLGRLRDDRLDINATWILAVETDMADHEVSTRVPGLSKIASWNEINKIVSAATPGVPLRPIHRPPDEIPIRPRQVYFSVTVTDRYFREILGEKAIAIYLPPPFDPSRAQLVLMAIPART